MPAEKSYPDMLRALLPSLAAARTLYAGAIGFVILAAFSWTFIDRIKYPVARFLKEGGAGGLPTFVIGLVKPPDVALLLLAATLFSAPLYREWRGREVSRALAEGAPAAMFVLLAALLVWFGHAYLDAGYLLAGDAGSHIARIAHLRMALQEGASLGWDNYFYAGTTVLQFTGPLFFWIATLVDLLVQDANLSAKLVLFALHIGAGLLLYRLLLEYGVARFAALIGAVAYAGSFAHLELILWEGTYPQAIVFVLLPLLVLLIERTGREPIRFGATAAALSLAVAALIVNHQASGLHAAVLLALYAVVRVAAGGLTRRALIVWIGAGAAAAVVALFSIAPILIEKASVMMYDHPEQLLRLEWPRADYWRELVVWSNGDARGQSAVYVGVTVVVLVLLGAANLRRPAPLARRRTMLALSSCLLLSFFLRGSHARHLIPTVFFLSSLAGFGAQALFDRFAGRYRVPALVLALLLLDLGATAIQPLARTDKAYFDDAGRYLERASPQERMLLTDTYEGRLRASIGPGGPPLYYYRVQTLTGPHNLAASLAHNYLAATIKLVEGNLRSHGELAPPTLALLQMLNVSRIVNDTGQSLGLPARVTDTTDEPPLGAVRRIRLATPVVYAPQVTSISVDRDLDKPVLWNEDFGKADHPTVARLTTLVRELPQQMRYDAVSGRAQTIFVRDAADRTAANAPARSVGTLQLRRYDLGFDRIALQFEASAPGYVQLAHAWHPQLRVWRNGAPVTPLRSVTNLLVLPVDAGLNEYQVVYVDSSVQFYSKLVSGAGFLSLAIYLVICAVRRLKRVELPA